MSEEDAMAEVNKPDSKIRPPTMLDALIPVFALVIMLVSAVYLYGGDATAGPFQVALILSAIIAGLVAYKNGHSFEKNW